MFRKVIARTLEPEPEPLERLMVFATVLEDAFKVSKIFRIDASMIGSCHKMDDNSSELGLLPVHQPYFCTSQLMSSTLRFQKTHLFSIWFQKKIFSSFFPHLCMTFAGFFKSLPLLTVTFSFRFPSIMASPSHGNVYSSQITMSNQGELPDLSQALTFNWKRLYLMYCLV